jgi:ubiquinone/menaquinone biosynthesis C-methylase UbiE
MRKIRSLFFRTGMTVLGVVPLPGAVLRWTIRLCLAVMVGKAPEKTLRNLFLVENDLSTMIDMVAIRYDQGVHVKHRLMRYHNFFTERIEPGEKVLDIGCGNGALTSDIAEISGAVVTGIDINEKNIAACRSRFSHPNLSFEQRDATQFMPTGHYDVIVLSNVLEHIQDRVKFLDSLCRNYQPSRLLIRVPMIDRSWHVPMRKELGIAYFSDDTHYTEYTMESFRQEMSEVSLKILYYQINWGEIWADVRIMS